MLNCHILKYTAPFKVICLTADYPWPCSPIWFQPKVIWIDKLKNKYLSFCRYFSVLYSRWSSFSSFLVSVVTTLNLRKPGKIWASVHVRLYCTLFFLLVLSFSSVLRSQRLDQPFPLSCFDVGVQNMAYCEARSFLDLTSIPLVCARDQTKNEHLLKGSYNPIIHWLLSSQYFLVLLSVRHNIRNMNCAQNLLCFHLKNSTQVLSLLYKLQVTKDY